MRNIITFIALLLFVSFSYGQTKSALSKNGSIPIKIKWVQNLKGDFSFKNKWSYPEGVDKNKYGQLICDGLCSSETINLRRALLI